MILLAVNFPVDQAVVSEETCACAIRDTIGQVIHEQEKQQGAQHCTLGHAREDSLLPGVLAFNHDPLRATFEEGPDPVMDWTSDSVEF